MDTICDGGVARLGMLRGEVQYPFALIENDDVVNISSISRENKRLHTYTCPGCGEELRPRLGDKRAHCFYHKNGNRCDIDKYIHDMAEKLLKKKFDEEEKFEVVMNVHSECSNFGDCIFRTNTCARDKRKTIDLKEHFRECLVEKCYGEFKPDLLLLPKNENKDPIFIEIWNKHKNSEKKSNSKYKIIEIKVQTLEALEELPKHPIMESDDVTFSHFNTIMIPPEKMEVPVKLMRYVLYERGTSYCGVSESDKCYSYGEVDQKSAVFLAIGRVIDFENDYFESGKVTMRGYAAFRARLKGYNPRSCYDCKNHRSELVNDVDGKSQKGLCCYRDVYRTGEVLPCRHEDGLSCEYYIPFPYRNTIAFKLCRFAPLFIKEASPRTTDEEIEFLRENQEWMFFMER